MCASIYFALMALFLYYSNFVIDQYALSISSGDGNWIAISLGWEIVPEIWPIFALVMLVSSALTLFVTLKIQGRPSN